MEVDQVASHPHIGYDLCWTRIRCLVQHKRVFGPLYWTRQRILEVGQHPGVFAVFGKVVMSGRRQPR